MTSTIIFAVIAFFLVVKLISVLGQKRHFDSSEFTASREESYSHHAAKPEIKEVEVKLENVTDPLARLKILYPTFDKKKFIKDSKDLYKSILKFYADGDTHNLSDLLNIEMMRKFAYQITRRETTNMKCKLTMLKIKDAVLENISFMHNTIANLQVVFDSEVIHYISDEKDNVTEGHKTKIDKRKDTWTFSKNIKSTTSNWKLVEVSNLF